MREERVLKLYNNILDYLLQYRRKHPDFTFQTRVNNRNERLKKGYWFQGTENYIFVPLYHQGCRDNKTKTIGFVVTENGEYIEIVFKNIVNGLEKEIKFHQELIEYLKSIDLFKKIEEKSSKQYFFWFENNNLEENLKFYITTFKKKADELIEKYELQNRYMISEETFLENIQRIDEYKEQLEEIANTEIGDKDIKMQKNNIVKNIVLYGVPGVGKTHNIGKLIQLIEEGTGQKEIFDQLRTNEMSKTINTSDLEDRVSFVTFHQSFGYEDFIEGFRPNESGDIVLSDGVFKRLCEKARKNLEDSQKGTEEVSKKVRFRTILEEFLDVVEDKIADNGSYKLTDNVYIFEIEDDALRYKGDNWTIHSAGIRMRFDILEKLYISDAHSRQDVKQVEGIGGLAKQHATYFWKVLEKIYAFEKEHDIQVDKAPKVERKNYYLVIDEINRGNISKIFGELITLIEEDKRNIYEVTLPYSKEKFSVPSNLYIIGTMNSTDKSIALIDVALRRRFTFLKMEPKVDLVADIAKGVFTKLNKILEDKLGKDHLIGHSYFMNIESDEDLSFVLEYKIRPLLEEYFYGDDDGLKEMLAIIEDKRLIEFV